MTAAIVMGIAIAVLPELARSTISLSPTATLYLPYSLGQAGEPLYAMGDDGAVEQMTYDAQHHHIYTVVGTPYLPYSLGPAGAPLYAMGDDGAVEQMTYDAQHHHIYTVGEARLLNVIDISDPKNPTVLYRLQLPGGATDVDSCRDYVAVAIHDDLKVLPGKVLIYSMYDSTNKNMALHHEIQVGALPDMVKFTKDCRTLVTCNEGEPGRDQSGNFVDPEGSASVIKFQSEFLAQEGEPNVTTATFRKFDSMAKDYSSQGVRWTLPTLEIGSEVVNFSLSQTLEPEYVAYNPDETKAYIVLQENNAIAVLDMATATFDDIYPLGSKYWGTASIDTSNADGGIVMRDWPIYSIYQPDSMRTFSHKGRNYILTANEGDGVERTPPNGTAASDELKGVDLVAGSLLSPNLKSERARRGLNLTNQLGCAVISSLDGLDPLNPGKYSSIHLFGGRGFSVWDAEDLSLVWDSGDDMERLTAKHYPRIFNSYYTDGFINDTVAGAFDGRSCKKGPETESLAIGSVGGKTVFFVGNERSSTIFLYTLADEDIVNLVFESIHWSGRTDMTWGQAYQDRSVGDVDPEDMRFVSASDSPTGSPLLLVVGTVSGTVSVYEVVETTDEIISASPNMEPSWLARTLTAVAAFLIYTSL